MKKVLLAVVLLVVVVAVAYFRFWRATERSATAFDAGLAEGQAELAEFQARVDSLKHLLVIQADSIVGSQAVQRNDHLCTIDSLIAVLDSATVPKGSEGAVVEKPASAEKPRGAAAEKSAASGARTGESVTPSEAAPTALPSDTTVCRAAMEYYQQLESELPADLSRYERKVAAYEISVKTARQFSISLAELKAIREAYSTTD